MTSSTKILIIEDEIVAGNRLRSMILDFDPTINIKETLVSVVDAINFLNDHDVDLIFMDIELSDGRCFEIFEHVQVDTPVIFITAYDQYMQEAFKVNSVDYLLKPVHPEDLHKSLQKFRKHHAESGVVQKVLSLLKAEQKRYKHRFLVRSGRGYVSIDVGAIAYFVYKHKLTYLVTMENNRYVIDYTLEHLNSILNPEKFHRISRNMIVSCESVQRIEPFFNNRLLLTLNPETAEDTIVSRSYIKLFRSWMDL